MNNKNYNRTSYIRSVNSNKAAPSSPSRADFLVADLSEEERELQRENQQFANTQYRNFFGKGLYRFAIYPSYWKDSWGKAPLLGIVNADDEFLAEKLAYDRGVLPSAFNCTFQPKIKNLGPNKNSR